MTEPLDLVAFAKRVGATAQTKGWDTPTWDNIPGKLALVITEVFEAVESTTVPGPESWDPGELADTFIRTIDILHTCFPTWPFDLRMATQRYSGRLPDYFTNHWTPTEVGWHFVRRICRAIESWRHGHTVDTAAELEAVLLDLYYLSRRVGVDLDKALLAKADINDQRPLRHGKKMTLG